MSCARSLPQPQKPPGYDTCMVVVWGVRWNTVVSGRLREERKGAHEVELVEELHDLLPVHLREGYDISTAAQCLSTAVIIWWAVKTSCSKYAQAASRHLFFFVFTNLILINPRDSLSNTGADAEE